MSGSSVSLKIDAATPLGHCLVGADLRVSACDRSLGAGVDSLRGTTAVELGQLSNTSALLDAVERIFLGADLATGRCRLSALPAVEGVHFEVRRLEGEAGPIALVTFHRPMLQSASARDPLTGLPQRDAIPRQLDFWRDADERSAFTVLFLDLDEFKAINDTYGHAAGDAVLRSLARRWKGCLRETDLAVRYGGDEFVVLLRDMACEADAEPIIARLLKATRRPIRCGELRLRMDVSIGMATGESGTDVAHLIDAADRDMYRRKRQLAR